MVKSRQLSVYTRF